uniref:Class II aldolase/adducin N-terminal domain-containing protein n=1 Tax=Panagrolaimus sp. PS1159 TaxID=55785 RepID=A0AC35G6Z2_9BILA
MESVSAFDQDMTSELFVEIMKLFFDRGWMVGSGGGMAATSKATKAIYYSPSSVQKERLLPNDLFVLSQETLELISRPQNPNIRESDCVPVFNMLLNDDEETNCPQVKTVLEKYPNASAILVRNHGLFVWGPTWQKTKIMLECYEYLFELACDMIKCSIPLVKSLKVN